MSASDAKQPSSEADGLGSNAHPGEGEGAGAANCRCTHGARPPKDASRYIHACHEQRWKLATWRKDGDGDVQWKPARCYSWRHAGPCARAKASQDYVRIKSGLSQHDRAHVCYAVLTLDPSAWTGEGWTRASARGVERRPDAKHDHSAISASYPALLDRWRMFAQSFRRKWGDLAYVSTVESHRSGWPHLNVVIVSPALAADVTRAGEGLDGWSRKAIGREIARRCFGDLLVRAGFGKIAFLESALALESDGEDRLAAYISKLAGETGQAWDGEGRGLVDSLEGQLVGEISKLSQAPTRAPEGFRRLRSSKGFLPPAAGGDDAITGGIFDEHGDAIGRTSHDAVIAAAYRAEGQARHQLAIEIHDAIDREMSRIGEVDHDGIVRGPRVAQSLRKLFRASRIVDGTDGEQLLQLAQRVSEAERDALRFRIERELAQDEEQRATLREMKKHRADARFPAMRTDTDRAKLRRALEILDTGESVAPSRRRILSPSHALEIRSREDIERVCATWGGGAAMHGPAARRYVLRKASCQHPPDATSES